MSRNLRRAPTAASSGCRTTDCSAALSARRWRTSGPPFFKRMESYEGDDGLRGYDGPLRVSIRAIPSTPR